ncbi:hypothetical protein BZG36_00508 [Bifiguratus adelaidae]|uniref:Pyrroline-5-carboxylate reductase n=1 Tax=Bifiguratus adelaidae TaxID=1938954 RepID=A0A261Y7G6_9FUNG|nr:hypothetical protein BZG36_00508 [Bifiguratus adelaidae]
MSSMEDDFSDYTLGVVGCGTMGVAILSGIHDHIASSDSSKVKSLPSKFIATVASEESAKSLVQTFDKDLGAGAVDVAWGNGSNVDLARKADMILLCCKPQVASVILTDPAMQEALSGKCVVSICAGVTIRQLLEFTVQHAYIIRAMPNTPCRIREGMTVISPSYNTPKHFVTLTQNIFSTLGRCRRLDERHLDAVTALSGSGPAFGCVVLEAFADGGVMMGLPRDVATELAAQSLQGAARMVLETKQHPAAIKDGVTTPGGCTIAGLLTMEDGKIRSTLARTIQEAAKVAKSLGGS